jgi:hypothetical protein
LADPVDRAVGDPAEHLAQIGFGIEAVHFGGLCRMANYAERARFHQPLS